MKAMAAMLAMLASHLALADEGVDVEKIKEAHAVLASMHFDRQVAAGAKIMADALAKTYASQGPLTNQHVLQVVSEETIQAVKEATTDAGGIVDSVAVVYANEFSMDELRQLHEFYDSPAARHLMDAQPAILQKAIPQMRELMRARMPAACARAKARLVAEKVENAENMTCPAAST